MFYPYLFPARLRPIQDVQEGCRCAGLSLTMGWRRKLAQAGNCRARLGIGNPGSFFSWLLGRPLEINPALLLCDLVEITI